MNFDIGSLAGDYQVIGILGAGGMGKVYKVRNTISDRMEAMKVLLPDLAGAPDLVDRFLREIKVMASLEHPNIASLRTAVRFQNQLLMILELVDGVTLEQKLKHAKLSVAEAVDYIGQVLSALEYAHRAGVIHRDIKPANMMLTANGFIKLMDFGIAKAATDRKLTMTGTTMGSLYYMSPEQIRGVENLDARSDLYSVGVSLYELVTGKKPFDGDSQFSIMSAHLEKTPVPPVSIDPKLPASLNDVILQSVQKDPNSRFQTAEAFRNALASVMAPIDASTVVAPPPTHPAKSRRALWVGAGAVAAVGTIIAVIELTPKKPASAERPTAPVLAVEAPVQAQPVLQPVTPPPNPTPSRKVTEPRPQGSDQRAAKTPEPVTPPAPAPSAPVPQKSEPAPDLAAAKRAELQKIRESLALLSARAAAVRSTLENLRRSQAASGLGMRSDWVQAETMMETFLKGANDALNASDAAMAQDFKNKAERQVDHLELALNK